MPSTKDFAYFETKIAYFESRPPSTGLKITIIQHKITEIKHPLNRKRIGSLCCQSSSCSQSVPKSPHCTAFFDQRSGKAERLTLVQPLVLVSHEKKSNFSSTSTKSLEMLVFKVVSEGGRGFFSSTLLPPLHISAD